MPYPPLIRQMLTPAFYPERPGRLHCVQTHISYVVFAGDHVYKIKKPVNLGFVDYSSLARRGAQCRNEVRLNRRLAPRLYRGVVKIYRHGKTYSLSPPGRVAEYAVLMDRLPERRLFSTRMGRGQATRADARRIADRLASFHAEAAPAARRFRGPGTLRRNLEENFDQTAPFAGRTIDRDRFLFLREYSLGFLRRRRALLKKRSDEGRHRDGHGDLHAGNICLTDGIVVYDCVEFSPRLRQADVAADIAFLYMDLLYHRHPHLASAFAERYLARSGDWEIRLLLSFYASYRAVVREKVEHFRMADPHVPAVQKSEARRRAVRYFALACDLARRDATPRLYLFGGLPGAGKTTAAAAWAGRLGADHFSSDVVRKELAGVDPAASCRAPFGEGIYSQEWTGRTYTRLISLAEKSLRDGRDVVLDATFTDRAHRRRAAGAARRSGAACHQVTCVVPESVALQRLGARTGGTHSDADAGTYREVKTRSHPPDDGALPVDTRLSLEEVLAAVAAKSCPV